MVKLAGFRGEDPELKSIDVKKIEVKGGEKYSFTYHYKTRDIIKNFKQNEAITLMRNELSDEFNTARLQATRFDLNFERHGQKTRLKRVEVSNRAAPSTDHNRAKNHLVSDTSRAWLNALGIVGKDGAVRHKSQDKFRQINKMVEIFVPLIQALKSKRPMIVDMGAGKGYLDFALYDYFANDAKSAVEIVGVEMRQHLVDDGNGIAKKSEFGGLRFEVGTILNFDASGADVVIALHACDTATDDAIFKGIQADAGLIAVAPCCHKQIRKEMTKGQADERLDVLLRHGVFMERQAEMATDTLRALLLELNGYRVKVFEFVSDAHSPKNVLIVGEKDGREGRDRDAILKQIAETKHMFGIERHYLEDQLGL